MSFLERVEWWLYIIYRVAQFALSLTACGLYGVDLTNAAAQKKSADGKWVFAEVTASLSVFTALFYLILTWFEHRQEKNLFTYHRWHPRVPIFASWDAILFILWLSVFSLFASMYISEDPEGNNGIERMKTAVWTDLTNWLLWAGSAAFLGWLWWKSNGGRTIWTGRAHV